MVTKVRCSAKLILAGSHNWEEHEFSCQLPRDHKGQHQGECIIHGFANLHAYWPIPEKG